jgi:glutamate synthase (NADPH/NADH) small chain
MADPRGFMKSPRAVAARRPVEERVHDWHEVYPESPGRAVLPIIQTQAGRCMDCGIPFCHTGCPLGNLIPEWNDLIWRDDWRGALDRLHATNNFPEFTGRLCPAPCETACVVGISRDPVTIKNVEVAIIDKAWDDRRVVPEQPAWHTLKTVAVVGSGPAGLAVAQQAHPGRPPSWSTSAPTTADCCGSASPSSWRRTSRPPAEAMRLEGTVFSRGRRRHRRHVRQTAVVRIVVLAIGSTVGVTAGARQELGIHQAMEFLPQANRVARGIAVADQIVATDKDGVIIGGGDTGADCLGTSIRQGARTVTQLEIMPTPPGDRPAGQPWPTYPMVYRVSSAHEEGGERLYSVNTQEFLGDDDGHVRALRLVEVRLENGRFEPVAGSEREIPAQLVLLAMGFTGPERTAVEQLGLDLDPRGNIARGADYQTNVPGVFVCGDAGRGQSLIVWAIAEGRSCANGVDAFLTGESKLPKPILPTVRPLMA